MKNNIVNIINFIRNFNPRNPQRDLVESVIHQIRMAEQYNLSTTFLLQYDALINPIYQELMLEKRNVDIEVGAWFEIVQPLVEKTGLKWRGREGYSWDWHANVGFTVGYTPDEREKLIDTYMGDFKSIFGKYPKSVGSWFIDAYSLAYLEDKYGVEAACMCRDQWGTDGYNLWGGYYNQAFYPSRDNMFSPAQSKENQINIPVFRMLGSDPIYQYDVGLNENFEPNDWQDVYTLEPCYPLCGGSEKWVRWFFKESFNNLALPFSYTQVGQENSFGWEKMKDGLEMQMKLLSQKVKNGEVTVQTLNESGRWFKSKFNVTPSSSLVAESDWKNEGHLSAWFYNRFYRANIFFEENSLWIRDIHRFDEHYQERYLAETCKIPQSTYDNLPIVDGYRWCGNNIRSGLYPVFLKNGESVEMTGSAPVFTRDNEEMHTKWQLDSGDIIEIICNEGTLVVSYIPKNEAKEWALDLVWNSSAIIGVSEKEIIYKYNGYGYKLASKLGLIKENNGKISIYPEKNQIILEI